MATATIEEGKLKDLIKNALIEVLESRRDLVQDAVEEAMEDFAFSRAIDEGLKSKKVKREKIFTNTFSK
jgi:hypothetical protein